jgi:hypothetical protein
MAFLPALQALDRLTVLDLTSSGPVVPGCGSWRIRAPTSSRSMRYALGSPRDGPNVQNLHRNKRAMALNLKSEGRAVFQRLAKTYTLVENLRPDLKAKLGDKKPAWLGSEAAKTPPVVAGINGVSGNVHTGIPYGSTRSWQPYQKPNIRLYSSRTFTKLLTTSALGSKA